MTNPKVIKNGEANTNTGYKRLVFSSDLELRPVAYAVHSGHAPNRGTFQPCPEPDDYLVHLTWNRKLHTLTVYQNHAVVTSKDDVMSKLEAKHPWITNWLRRQHRGGVWIPFDIVPLNKYLSYINKRCQYESFIKTYGIELTWEEWEISAKSGIRMKPLSDLDDWDSIVPYFRKGPKINTEDLFYGSNGDGTSTLLESDPTMVTYNATNTRAEISVGSPIVFPRQFKFIIRVIKGGYIRNDVSYGISVEVRLNRKVGFCRHVVYGRPKDFTAKAVISSIPNSN